MLIKAVLIIAAMVIAGFAVASGGYAGEKQRWREEDALWNFVGAALLACFALVCAFAAGSV